MTNAADAVPPQPLSIDTHRYHLVEAEQGRSVWDVFEASVLSCGPEFWHGPTVSWGPAGGGLGNSTGSGSGSDLDSFLWSERFRLVDFEELTPARIEDLCAVLTSTRSFSNTMRALLGEHMMLRRIHQHDRQRLLGRLGILEAALTHQPQDRNDRNITYQLKAKMALLMSRFRRPLLHPLAQKMEPDALWPLLYRLRSTIAHGAVPDFADKSLRDLGSMREAEAMVVDAVRSVLRQMIEEPRLLADLKRC